MMHKNRRWILCPVPSPEELAANLAECTWTLCTGFELDGYIFLNDSTSPDGAQEYAIIKMPCSPTQAYTQVESVTFGWCDYSRALHYVVETVTGQYDGRGWARTVVPLLDSLDNHGTCRHCA